MRRKLLLLCLVALLTTGCFGSAVRDSDKDVIATDGLKISFIANRGGNSGIQALSGNFHSPIDHVDKVFTRDVYREPYRSGNEGQLVGTFTPSSFIVSLGNIQVSNPRRSFPLSLRKRVDLSPDSSWGILPNFDLAYADGVLDASYIIKEGDFEYDSIRLTFFTRNVEKNQGPNQELSFIGEVKVDLGPEYAGIPLKNSKGITEDGLHVFEIADLIPLEGREKTPSTSIFFDHNVEEAFIVNPDGEYVADFRPHFWDTPTRWGMAGYVIYNPGLELDLRKGNHLVFEWDLVDLIEIYDNHSDDPSEHLVTFRLDNPFPITFYLEQLSGEPTLPAPVPLKEVDHLDIGYFDFMDRLVLLKWTNPAIETLKRIRIVRSEGKVPQSIDDGEEVYADKFPIFEDRDIEEGRHYYYRLFVEDIYGNLSKGRVIDVETNPPLIDFIELLIDGKRYEEDGDSLEMTVGESARVYALSNSRFAASWTISDPAIAAVDHEKGHNNRLRALQPGVTELTLSAPESFGGLSATFTIIVTE